MSAAANTAAARALIEGLARAGVRDACVTPGSRSTPLTVALAEQDAIRPWLHLDERSSAFFALGLARASGRPVALVCTSGTAAVNFHPAVVEAELSRVPLIVCTADRPRRLRNVGAPQTIDQVGLYGVSVRHERDFPVPGSPDAPPHLFAEAGREAVVTSLSPLPGPVHLNLPFDEPLIAPPAAPPGPTAAPIPGPLPAVPALPPATPQLEAATEALYRSERPIIVAGPESGGLPARALAALALALRAPVLADPLSGLRTGPHDRTHVVDAYDAFLRDPRAITLAPDCVLRFGAAPTSKALNQFLVRASDVPGATHILCDLPGSFRDPNGVTTHRLTADPRSAADALRELVAGQRGSAWLAQWRDRDARARAALSDYALAATEPFEGRAVVELQRALPAGATIFAGSSMPVRDVDAFLAGDAKPLAVASNRGANGIDGVVSSALGHAAAGAGPVALLIGDLSLFHDLNGLWAAARHGLDLTVLLVNNAGSAIFHYLPQAAHGHVFEEWFGTPSDVDFAAAAKAYGASHRVLDDWEELDGALAGEGQGVCIVEFRTDRVRNHELHEEAWARASEAAWS
ncbi:MAG: 2-succinyl-5-enolpyruvyl-6-hydroxy-3-cyclohexene-1-carboxylic-acid synthase [Chloroflexi bacterium]|nr:2-succinyl-5-enolpyruvyl-6-hydroxy-3-cyclohexene-1-carboxylic-acid synthase [Chloroflexota bacterium]